MATNQDQLNPGKVEDAFGVSERNLKNIVQYNVSEPCSYIEKSLKGFIEKFAPIQSRTYCLRWAKNLPLEWLEYEEAMGAPPATTGSSPVAEAFC